MKNKSTRNIRLVTLCGILLLSIASYVFLLYVESGNQMNPDAMAEEVRYQDALPDVQLLKKLMNKTLEFMLNTPGL